MSVVCAALGACVTWVSGDAVDADASGPVWVPVAIAGWLLAGAIGGFSVGARVIPITLGVLLVAALAREAAGEPLEPLRFMTWCFEGAAFVAAALVGLLARRLTRRRSGAAR